MRHDLAIIATHVSPSAGYGGVAESSGNLARGWAAQRHSFVLCSSDASITGRIRREEIELGPTVTVRLYRSLLFKRWGFGPGALLSIVRSCWQAQAIYINGIATWPTTVGAITALILRRPYIIAPRGGLMRSHVREIRAKKMHKWLYYKMLTIPTCRRALAIHVTSEQEKQGVTDILPSGRIVQIANGVDLSRWYALPPDNKKCETVMSFVGRVEPEKGINGFVRVWLAERGNNDSFLIAGAGHGSYAVQLHDLAATSGGTVNLLGLAAQAEVHRVLGASHFLVLPSGFDAEERENFGNVVAEAMATARPVIVARGLAWDWIEQKGVGLLFDRTNEGVREVIRRAQNINGGEYLSMSRAARLYAETHLDLRDSARDLWRVLTEQVKPG